MEPRRIRKDGKIFVLPPEKYIPFEFDPLKRTVIFSRLARSTLQVRKELARTKTVPITAVYAIEIIRRHRQTQPRSRPTAREPMDYTIAETKAIQKGKNDLEAALQKIEMDRTNQQSYLRMLEHLKTVNGFPTKGMSKTQLMVQRNILDLNRRWDAIEKRIAFLVKYEFG